MDMNDLPQWMRNAAINASRTGGALGNNGINVQAAEGAMSFANDVPRVPLLYLDPLFDTVLMIFPQDNLRELNRRLRHYYKYDPYIRSSVDFHTEQPLSDFELKCPQNEEAEAYYKDFKQRRNLLNVFINGLRDYWCLGECEKPGTGILMADGTEKAIEDIRAGERVISHTGRARTVIVPTIKFVDEELYGLTIRGNGNIKHWSTGNHPILVARETKKRHAHWRKDVENFKIEYIQAKDVRPGDYVLSPRTVECNDASNVLLARLLGYYASEGCLLRRPRYINDIAGIAICNTDQDIVNDVRKLSNTLCNREPYVRTVNGCKVMNICSAEFGRRIAALCHGHARDKKLADEVLNWPHSHQIEFLKTFILGDGSVDNGHATLYTSSPNLASQLHTICVRLGMHPSRCITTKSSNPPRSRGTVTTTIYQIKLTKDDSVRLREDIGKLANIRPSLNHDRFSLSKDNFLLRQTIKTETEPYKGSVHCLEVEEDHSFVAEGIAVHNCFIYGNWDSEAREFSEFVQIPPEEMEIHSVFLDTRRVYVLRPNVELGKMMRSYSPADQQIAEMLRNSKPLMAQAIEESRPFILDPNRLFVMQREMAGYVNRGISPLLAVVKDLIFQDNLNMFRTAFIQQHSYPLKLFKLGHAEKGYIPSRKMFREFRALLIQARNDPNFDVVTHPFVQVEYHTGQDKILPLVPWYDLVKSRILAGLFISEALISGEKTPYAAGITFMRGLMNRYLTVRNTLEIEANRKIFTHLARKHNFTEPSMADASHRIRTRTQQRKLILPTFLWQKANLLASQQMQQMILNLRDKGEIPFRFVAELFGWNNDDILYQFKREASSPVDLTWRKVRDRALMDDPELAERVLKGDTIEEAIKSKAKIELKKGKEPKKREEERVLTTPEVQPAKFKARPEEGPRPAEAAPEEPARPGEAGESPAGPRPAEAGGVAGPGGAAGGAV